MEQNSTTTKENFIAKTYHGLEPFLADELKKLQANDIQELKRGVSFTGNLQTLYRANMYLRTAIRILRGIKTFQAKNEDELYKGIYQIRWEKWLQPYETLAVDAVVGSHFFRHSHYVALKTKDAIVDRFRQNRGKRPSVDLDNPTLRIHINLQGAQVRVLLDSSGSSLHKRGYRTEHHPAPLSEALAAGLIMQTGWDLESPFVDPMCGSGTIPIEAALMASRTAPGLIRKKFGFQKWPDFDKRLWTRIKREAETNQKATQAVIIAADISDKSLSIAHQHARQAGVESLIEFKNSAFENWSPEYDSGTLLVNPPYGERLSPPEIASFYKSIGDQLKNNYKGWKAWIISSNMEALKRIGLKASAKYSVYNGSLACKFQQYDLY